MPRPSTVRTVELLAVAAVLALASCGGGGSGSEARDGGDRTTVAAPGDDGATPAAAPGAAEPNLLLPTDTEAPAGFRTASEHCPAGPGEPDYYHDDVARTWIGYHVPDHWQTKAYFGDASGGPHSSETLHFATDDPSNGDSTVEVDVTWDGRSPDGSVLGFDGEPSESFDYEAEMHGLESNTYQITYEEVATVEVGGTDVALYFRDPTQNTGVLGTIAHYKARVDAYELPDGTSTHDGLTPYSFVVTVEFDTDDTAVEQDVVEQILGSITMPRCTWNEILAAGDVRPGVDPDGDGHARNADG